MAAADAAAEVVVEEAAAMDGDVEGQNVVALHLAGRNKAVDPPVGRKAVVEEEEAAVAVLLLVVEALAAAALHLVEVVLEVVDLLLEDVAVDEAAVEVVAAVDGSKVALQAGPNRVHLVGHKAAAVVVAVEAADEVVDEEMAEEAAAVVAAVKPSGEINGAVVVLGAEARTVSCSFLQYILSFLHVLCYFQLTKNVGIENLAVGTALTAIEAIGAKLVVSMLDGVKDEVRIHSTFSHVLAARCVVFRR